jgi:hypothetical protein
MARYHERRISKEVLRSWLDGYASLPQARGESAHCIARQHGQLVTSPLAAVLHVPSTARRKKKDLSHYQRWERALIFEMVRRLTRSRASAGRSCMHASTRPLSSPCMQYDSLPQNLLARQTSRQLLDKILIPFYSGYRDYLVPTRWRLSSSRQVYSPRSHWQVSPPLVSLGMRSPDETVTSRDHDNNRDCTCVRLTRTQGSSYPGSTRRMSGGT